MTLFPYTTLFRSGVVSSIGGDGGCTNGRFGDPGKTLPAGGDPNVSSWYGGGGGTAKFSLLSGESGV